MRSIKAIANCKRFANGKVRAIAIDANANDYATLHAHFSHEGTSWRGSLRGLLRTAIAVLARLERTALSAGCGPTMRPQAVAVRQPRGRVVVAG